MLQKTFLLICCLFFLFIINGQNNKGDTNSKGTNYLTQRKIVLDTLKIQTIEQKQIEKTWYKDNNMPWIAAILISLLSFLLNILLANANQKASRLNINNQIQSSSQIANNQIRATLNTNNRQAWVTEVRNVLSELITQSKSFNIELHESTVNIAKKKDLHEKVTYNHTKLLLLLNPAIEYHKPLLSALVAFMTVLDRELLNSEMSQEMRGQYKTDNVDFFSALQKIIDSGRSLLYTEWGKIQLIT